MNGNVIPKPNKTLYLEFFPSGAKHDVRYQSMYPYKAQQQEWTLNFHNM